MGQYWLPVNLDKHERKAMSAAAPMPEDYPAVAARTIGRWAGDRIALVGDYAEDGDLAPEHAASTIYGRCREEGDAGRPEDGEPYTDVSADVGRVIEHGWEARRSQQRRELAWWLGATILAIALLAIGRAVFIDLWAVAG